MREVKKIPKILLAKIGLDGHSRGVYVVADGLRKAGMEVVYTGLRQLPSQVAQAAIQEDVDIIGISSLAGAHISTTKKLKAELDKLGVADIPIIIGGIIPDDDYITLSELGVNKIFPPGSKVSDIAAYIYRVMEEQCGNRG
ncbi:cobalamin-dependent protein [Thermodesulfobacteriota bacterium]